MSLSLSLSRVFTSSPPGRDQMKSKELREERKKQSPTFCFVFTSTTHTHAICLCALSQLSRRMSKLPHEPHYQSNSMLIYWMRETINLFKDCLWVFDKNALLRRFDAIDEVAAWQLHEKHLKKAKWKSDSEKKKCCRRCDRRSTKHQMKTRTRTKRTRWIGICVSFVKQEESNQRNENRLLSWFGDILWYFCVSMLVVLCAAARVLLRVRNFYNWKISLSIFFAQPLERCVAGCMAHVRLLFFLWESVCVCVSLCVCERARHCVSWAILCATAGSRDSV